MTSTEGEFFLSTDDSIIPIEEERDASLKKLHIFLKTNSIDKIILLIDMADAYNKYDLYEQVHSYCEKTNDSNLKEIYLVLEKIGIQTLKYIIMRSKL